MTTPSLCATRQLMLLKDCIEPACQKARRLYADDCIPWEDFHGVLCQRHRTLVDAIVDLERSFESTHPSFSPTSYGPGPMENPVSLGDIYHSDGLGTHFKGKLVDPVTRRQVLTCETCGRLMWFGPEPCYVSVMCTHCMTHCADCGQPTPMVNPGTASEKHGGRPLCSTCWGV